MPITQRARHNAASFFRCSHRSGDASKLGNISFRATTARTSHSPQKMASAMYSGGAKNPPPSRNVCRLTEPPVASATGVRRSPHSINLRMSGGPRGTFTLQSVGHNCRLLGTSVPRNEKRYAFRLCVFYASLRLSTGARFSTPGYRNTRRFFTDLRQPESFVFCG